MCHFWVVFWVYVRHVQLQTFPTDIGMKELMLLYRLTKKLFVKSKCEKSYVCAKVQKVKVPGCRRPKVCHFWVVFWVYVCHVQLQTFPTDIGMKELMLLYRLTKKLFVKSKCEKSYVCAKAKKSPPLH